HVRLLRAADPIESRGIMSNKATRMGRWTRLGNDPEQRAFVWVQHAASVEFDDDAKHVVVLQQVGNLFQLCRQPGKKEGIRAQARKYAKHSVRGGCSFFVIDDNTQRLAVRKGAGAVLDGRCSVAPRLECAK